MEEAAGEASEKWLEERKEGEPFGHSVSFEIVSKKNHILMLNFYCV